MDTSVSRLMGELWPRMPGRDLHNGNADAEGLKKGEALSRLVYRAVDQCLVFRNQRKLYLTSREHSYLAYDPENNEFVDDPGLRQGYARSLVLPPRRDLRYENAGTSSGYFGGFGPANVSGGGGHEYVVPSAPAKTVLEQPLTLSDVGHVTGLVHVGTRVESSAQAVGVVLAELVLRVNEKKRLCDGPTSERDTLREAVRRAKTKRTFCVYVWTRCIRVSTRLSPSSYDWKGGSVLHVCMKGV
eukprot:GFKZ01010556.1.p1 GENE.GFKZ01010556.1~~GFKZ01010556.1.p1  ORF type:complete len:243 (-),score=13.92 GFKZ01010556.1:3595-4323(-)